MHIFDYSYLKNDLLPAKLVNLTSSIAALRVLSAERKVRFMHAYSELERIAKIESVKASNAIEGIVTTDARLAELMQEGTSPMNHTEAEISGYRDALNEIHLNHRLHDFTESDIIGFYGMLLRYVASDVEPGYKHEDNVIAERMSDGRRVVRFSPASAEETPEAMKQLVLAYMEARDDVEINKMLLIPCVILDFLCIHPFPDGKYISFEQRINADKAAYYAALRDSSAGWQTNENSPFPFMVNFLMTLYGCYEELDRRFAVVSTGRVTKSARIKSIVLNALTPISKVDICRALPDVSPTTVEAVLGSLVKNGAVRKVGEGRSVKYIRGGDTRSEQ